MAKKVEKVSVSLFISDENEPIAMVYFNKNRERVIYTITKADETEIIALFENNFEGRIVRTAEKKPELSTDKNDK